MPKIRDGGWLSPSNDESDITIGFTLPAEDSENKNNDETISEDKESP